MTSGDVSILKKKIIKVRARISKNSQTIRSVTALFSSNIVSSVLTAIGGLLVARFLWPDEAGSFRAFTIPLTYLIFLHLGTWDGLWRQIPYYVGKEMPEKVEVLASSAGAFNLLVSFVVSCGFICCAIYSLAHHDFYGVFGWLSQAFFCWGVFYGGYLTSTYRTLHHFVTLARIQVAQSVLTFGMVFLLPFFRFYGLCARAAFPPFLAVWLFHRHRPLKVIYRFNTRALRELIKIGLPFSFWGNLETSVWTATESALVLSLGGVTALGLFSIAVVVRGAVNSLPMSIWQVFTPRVVTALARDGSVRNANARIIWVTAGLTGFMILLACAGSFLLEVFVPHFIPKYIAGIPVMKICLWFSVVQAAFLPINILFATGRPWLYGRSVIAGLVVFPLATYLLLPVIGGLLAVAVGSLLGRAARTLAAYVDLVALTRRET
ncbi:MAG: lipopolysaccharide biosynthesis protein [Syntrophales bacterium]